jgi:hypothetical protein
LRVAVFALTFLTIGFIISALSITMEINFKEIVLDSKENICEISGYFNDGEKIIVKFWPSDKWRDMLMEPATDEIPYPHSFAYFNIVGPLEETAIFEVTIVRLETNTIPYVFQIILLEAGSLTVSTYGNNRTDEIGGIVNFSGNYTAVFDGIFPPSSSPQDAMPQSLSLYKGIPEKSYPHIYLIPVGITAFIFGFALLLRSRKITRVKPQHTRGQFHKPIRALRVGE